MSLFLKTTIVLLFLLPAAISVSAQGENKSGTTTAQHEDQSAKSAPSEEDNLGFDSAEDIPEYYRHHKKMTGYYTGYVIELTTSAIPLRRNYHLFDKFGGIHYDRLEGGGFSYFIIGYSDKKAAEQHLEQVVRHQAPEAKVVYYLKGKRR